MRLTCLLLTLVALFGSLTAVSQQTVTGPQVPDVDAERMLFVYLQSQSPAGADTKQTKKAQSMVSDPADVLTLLQNVDSFNTQYQTLSTNYNNLPVSTSSRQTFLNNRDSLVASTYNTILTSISSTDASQLGAYVQALKSNISTQILTDGTTGYSYLDTLKPYGFLPAGCLDGSNQDCDEFATPIPVFDDGYLNGSNSPDGCTSIASVTDTFTGGNVWETLPLLPNMAYMSISPSDGTVIAGDSSGVMWEYAPIGFYAGVDNGWSKLPSPKTMSNVAVGNVNAIYGIDSAGTIYLYQTATQTWGSLLNTSGYSHIAVTHDGILWASKGGGVYKMVNNTLALQYTDAYPIISLSAATANSFGAPVPWAAWVDGNNAIYRSTNGTVTALPLTGLVGKATLITVNPDKSTFAVDNTQAVYSYGSSWVLIPGHKLSYLATSSSQTIFGLDATSRGTFSYFPNTVTSQSTSLYNDGTDVSLAGSITTTAPAGFSFTSTAEGKVKQVCKGLVTIIFDTLVTYQPKFAYERVHFLPGTRSGCNNVGVCDHAVEPWCSGAHLANIVDVSEQESLFLDSANYIYWETFEEVIPGKALLFPGIAIGDFANTPLPTAACTPN